MTLSTHVLDTTHGTPATGVRLRLLSGPHVLFDGVTNGDGRCPELKTLAHKPGHYRLEFWVADYFRGRKVALSEPPFLDVVGIDFAMADDSHYHVPLLVSPYGYSTYRGS